MLVVDFHTKRKHRRLYFGRDPLGRRSLLLHYPTEKHPFFSLSSVSIGPGYGCIFKELDSKYIYSIDLSQSSLDRLSLDSSIHRKARVIQPGLPSFVTPLVTSCMILLIFLTGSGSPSQ